MDQIQSDGQKKRRVVSCLLIKRGKHAKKQLVDRTHPMSTLWFVKKCSNQRKCRYKVHQEVNETIFTGKLNEMEVLRMHIFSERCNVLTFDERLFSFISQYIPTSKTIYAGFSSLILQASLIWQFSFGADCLQKQILIKTDVLVTLLFAYQTYLTTILIGIEKKVYGQ